MNYLFTGNSTFLVSEGVNKWKNQFIEKYGDFNLIHIRDIDSFELDMLYQNIFSSSFLIETKLIILDLNNKISEEKVDFLIKNLDNIPGKNMVIFNYPEPDKRLKLLKELEKKSEKKEFNLQSEIDVINLVSSRYQNRISKEAINLICKFKSNKINKIISELEKLFILYDYVNEEIIKNYIVPELEENIFQLIDDILNRDIISALRKIDIILNDTSIYAFYNNLLANLRTSVFIMKLKQSKLPPDKISNILNLGNKAFLINKNYKISYKKFSFFYLELVNLDKKMKSGTMIGTEESDFRFELETCLIKIAS